MVYAEGGGVGVDMDELTICQDLAEVGGPLVQFRANGKNEVAMLEGAHGPAITKTPAHPGVERVTGEQAVGQQGGHQRRVEFFAQLLQDRSRVAYYGAPTSKYRRLAGAHECLSGNGDESVVGPWTLGRWCVRLIAQFLRQIAFLHVGGQIEHEGALAPKPLKCPGQILGQPASRVNRGLATRHQLRERLLIE
jgi:hypothetical protein